MRKDVQLVIRAKDEAGRAVDAITDAINSLVGSQDKLVRSAERSDSVLGDLGAALGALDSQLRGFEATDKIAQQFDRANAASDRLKRGVEGTAREYTRLSAELKKATFEADRLNAKSEGAAGAQERQKAALREAQQTQRQFTAELKKGTAERGRLIAADQRLSAQIEKQGNRVSEASQKYIRLSAEIERTAEPTKRLQNSFEAAGRALVRQDTLLEKYRGQQAETRKAIADTGGSLAKLETSLAGANQAVSRQEAVLAKIKDNYANLRAESSAASREQTKLATATDRAKTASARAQSEFAQTEEGLTELAFASDRANIAMQKLADNATLKLRRNMLETRREVKASEAEWKKATATVAQLAARMRSTENPSDRLNDRFRESVQIAQRAKAAYEIQRDGLGQLQAALRGAANGGFGALGQRIEQVDTSLAGLAARQARYVAAQRRTEQALEGLGNEAREASAETRRLATGTRQGSQAHRTATRTIDRQTAAYRKLYGESRRALSFTQRLRGEVLSLAASFGGFFAAIEILGDTVDAFQTLEGATSRLNVVFNGDQAAVAEELDFIRRSADRLGIEFGALSQEYTKFAVATQGTNLEGQRTRKIFTSVAEAARVNKTSTEDMQGVFVALTQIVSKGTVSMEELRQQLGDRLPGALQLMGAGLGYGSDQMGEFIKAIENGQISSDALVGFAEELDRRFGSQLPKALQTTTTEIGRFRNNIFQALLTLGEGGFIDSFTELLRAMNEQLSSADGQAFLTTLGGVFGTLVDLLTLAVENFQLILVLGSAFIGLKLVSVIEILRLKMIGFGASTRAAGLSAAGFSRNMAVASRALQIAGVNATRTRVLMLALTRSFRAFLATSGIGLVVLAASVAVGIFAGQADKAQEAAAELTTTVDKLKNAYEQAEGDANKFNAAVDGLSTTKARQQIIDLRNEIARLRRDIISSQGLLGVQGLFDGSLVEGFRLVNRAEDGDQAAIQIAKLKVQFRDGEISAKAYRAALDEVGATTDDRFLIKAIANAQELAEDIEKLEDQANEAEKALSLLDEGGFERQKTLDSLRGSADPLNPKQAGSKTKEKRDPTEDAIANAEFAIRQQKLINDGLDEQARREKVIRDARRADKTITDAELDRLVALSDEMAALESAAKKTKLASDISDELKANADAAAFELSLVGKTNQEREVAIAIRRAENRLAEEGLTLGEAQKEQIAETVRLLQDAESQQKISEFRESLGQQIADKEFELSLRDKELTQREVAKALREAEQAAQEAGTKLTDEEAEAIRRVTTALNEKAAAEERAKAARENVSDAEDAISQLESRRDALVAQFDAARAQGDESRTEQLREQIFAVNEEMLRAIENAKTMWGAIGGAEAAAAIEQLNVATLEANKFAKVSDDILIDWSRVGQLFASGLSNAVDSFAESVADGGNAFDSALNAFRQFASDFLRQIAQMILQQLFLNAISGFTGAIPGLNSTGALGGLFPSFHSGGIVGRASGNQRRSVDPRVFMGAGRFHEGGLPGLTSDEVPAILKKNEEVLTEDDPRNILNGGGEGGGGQAPVFQPKIVNAFDAGSFMSEGLNSTVGEKVFMNFVRANSGAIRAALGG